jgi:hypothetical protein
VSDSRADGFRYEFRLEPVESSISVAGAAVAAVADRAGLDGSPVSQLRCLVEEIVRQSIDRVGEAESDPVVVEVERHGTLLETRVRDRGLPSQHAPLPPLASSLVELGFAEAVRTSFAGRDGNVVELQVALPQHHAIIDEGEQLPDDVAPAPDEDLDVRRATPDDADEIARCIYRTYGYTYPNGLLYFPDRLAGHLAEESLVSFLAANAAGEVVAHIGFKAMGTSGRTCFEGYGVTDPRYRRRGLMLHVGAAQEQELERRGILAPIGTPVTTHRVTQEAMLRSGSGKQLGVLLGWHMPVKQIGFTDGVLAQRSTALFCCRLRGPLPERELHPPADFASYVQRVVDHNELPRSVEPTRPRAADAAPAASRLSVDVDGENRLATLTVEEPGRDLLDAVTAHLRDLARTADVVHLDLPLDDASAGAAATGFRELGFVYCTLIPEMRPDGDVLRLQYLPEVDIDADQFDLATDFSRQLVDDLMQDLADVSRRDERSRVRRATIGRLLSVIDGQDDG